MSLEVQAVVAVVFVSLLPFLGFLGLILGAQQLDRLKFALVSFATGALLSDALIHLLPEAYSRLGHELPVALTCLCGIVLFFLLEKFVHFHHSPLDCAQQTAADPEHLRSPVHHHHHHQHHYHHDGHRDHRHHNHHGAHRSESPSKQREQRSLIVMAVAGDMLHNLMDGVLIGAAFGVNSTIGWSTTLAIALHEIPHEVSGLAVLLHAGMSPVRAVLVNFYTGGTAIVGCLVALVAGAATQRFSVWALPLAAGGFLYLAGSVLVPEMRQERLGKARVALQVLALLLGVGAMVALKLGEKL